MADPATEQVRDFLIHLNACWQTGDLQALEGFYHPEVVLLPPDLGPPIRGREAVVASYLEFLQAATLDHFEVLDLDVFPFPAGPELATYVAHLTFAVTYTLDGETYVEKGLEAYTLSEEAGRLKILWRHQSVLDSRIEAKS
jgi:ketosteroid isomerase-like protein